ncbi:MAG: hypothetical protein WC378_19830 [Opitutaceae bacterium]|jgi:hypothetical protein
MGFDVPMSPANDGAAACRSIAASATAGESAGSISAGAPSLLYMASWISAGSAGRWYFI